MRIQKVYSLTDVLHNMLCDIEEGKKTDDNGDPMSDYYTIAYDTNGNDLCASLIRYKDEDYLSEYYSLHVIDNITMRNCVLDDTSGLDEMEVLCLLSEELNETINKVCDAD